MNMPTSNTYDPPPGAFSRALGEDVLQSAEDAVRGNHAAAQGTPDQVFAPAASGAEPAAVRSPKGGKLAQQVAEKPLLSALLALGAGALLAALARSALQRRRR